MEGERIIRIKGMVCDRCIQVVDHSLKDLGLEVRAISLGSATVTGLPNRVSMMMVEHVLVKLGFEVQKDQSTALADEIKQVVNEWLDCDHIYEIRQKYAEVLSEKLAMPYETVKARFLRIEGMTLEKYIINQRIEKAKRLLVHTNITLTEIAYLLGFSSLQHFSGQFKDQTGLSPSYFQKLKAEMAR